MSLSNNFPFRGPTQDRGKHIIQTPSPRRCLVRHHLIDPLERRRSVTSDVILHGDNQPWEQQEPCVLAGDVPKVCATEIRPFLNENPILGCDDAPNLICSF